MNLFKVSSEISMENIDWFTTVETFSGIQSDYAKLFFLSQVVGKNSQWKCVYVHFDWNWPNSVFYRQSVHVMNGDDDIVFKNGYKNLLIVRKSIYLFITIFTKRNSRYYLA